MTACAPRGRARHPDAPVPGRELPWTSLLQVAEARAGGQVVLTLAGDIDVTTAGLVRDAAARCLVRRPAGLLLDLGLVEFCDCAGVRALRWVARRAAVSGSGFAITALGPPVRRVLDLVQARDLLAAVHDPGPDPPAGGPPPPGVRQGAGRDAGKAAAALAGPGLHPG